MRTAEKMFPIVEDWLASGQLQKDYSHEHGIPKHILSYWVCRYRRSQEVTDENATGFTELIIVFPSSKNLELL